MTYILLDFEQVLFLTTSTENLNGLAFRNLNATRVLK